MTRNVRIFVLLVAIAAMLGVSVASASPVHAHTKARAASCEICFSAHVTAFETPLLIAFHAPVLSRRAQAPVVFQNYEDVRRQPRESRGPPASL